MHQPNIWEQISSRQRVANRRNGEDPKHPTFLQTARDSKAIGLDVAQRSGELPILMEARKRFGEPILETQLPHDYEALFSAFFQFWRLFKTEDTSSLDLPIFATASLRQSMALRLRDSEGRQGLLFNPIVVSLATTLAAALAPYFLRTSPACVLRLPIWEVSKKLDEFPDGLNSLTEIIDNLIAFNRCPRSRDFFPRSSEDYQTFVGKFISATYVFIIGHELTHCLEMHRATDVSPDEDIDNPDICGCCLVLPNNQNLTKTIQAQHKNECQADLGAFNAAERTCGTSYAFLGAASLLSVLDIVEFCIARLTCSGVVLDLANPHAHRHYAIGQGRDHPPPFFRLWNLTAYIREEVGEGRVAKDSQARKRVDDHVCAILWIMSAVRNKLKRTYYYAPDNKQVVAEIWREEGPEYYYPCLSQSTPWSNEL
jgi:hypothetical protein